jgi:hypothetical protein
MSTGHKLQLARKNGKAGGLAWARKTKANNPHLMSSRALLSCERQKAIYGGLFANKVNRNPEARIEARRKAGKASAAKRWSDRSKPPSSEKIATTPVSSTNLPQAFGPTPKGLTPTQIAWRKSKGLS